MTRLIAALFRRPAPEDCQQAADRGDYEMDIIRRAMSPQYAGDRS